MFRNIVVATDASEASHQALALAIGLAKEGGGKLVLVTVIDLSTLLALSGYESPYPVDAIKSMRDEGQASLDAGVAAAAKDGVTASTVVGEGDPSDEILRIAKEQQADLICIGTHGRKGLARLFLGSVAEGVLRRAEAPVLVTRPRTP
ncbi:MAG TPA: universal stress protein [Candidatus Dormibacteraeota bacterium]|nr:universal stress protein [Candidatus Dormibacteraeota bacterium]